MKHPTFRISLILCLALAPLAQLASAQEVTISNVRAEQRSGTKLIDILYDLDYEGEDSVEIGVQVSADGGNTFNVVPVETLDGDVGQSYSIEPGTDLLITWNAGVDWPQQFTSQAVVKVTAATFVPDPNAPPPGYSLVDLTVYGDTFAMGSPSSEIGRFSTETQHMVTLTRNFFIQQIEATNDQVAEVFNWALANGHATATVDTSTTIKNVAGNQQTLFVVDGSTELTYSGGALTPKANFGNVACEQITFYGAMAYCYFLNIRDGLDQTIDLSNWTMDPSLNGYRLPTEAEWEYACRAGTTTAFNTGEAIATVSDPSMDLAGWYQPNSGGSVTVGGQKTANNFQLYDMHGNIAEWVYDWYLAYPTDPVTDPTGAASGSNKIVRGGQILSAALFCRSACRTTKAPTARSDTDNVGFRPVRTLVVVAP